MNNKTYLTNIKVSDGQFSGEKAIRVTDYSGTETSGFFENQHIREGKLEVIIVQEKGELVLIKLPGQMLEPPGDKGYINVLKKQVYQDL
jgi:hypothetical protein